MTTAAVARAAVTTAAGPGACAWRGPARQWIVDGDDGDHDKLVTAEPSEDVAQNSGPKEARCVLEEFDFKFQPSVDQKLVRELGDGERRAEAREAPAAGRPDLRIPSRCGTAHRALRTVVAWTHKAGGAGCSIGSSSAS